MRDDLIGARIANARVRRGVGRRALAEYCGLTEAQLYDAECGHTRLPQEAIVAVAKALILREQDLLAGSARWELTVRHLRPIAVLGLLMDEATQFAAELGVTSDDRFPAFREKEEPVAAPPSAPQPVAPKPVQAAKWTMPAYGSREFFAILDAMGEGE